MLSKKKLFSVILVGSMIFVNTFPINAFASDGRPSIVISRGGYGDTEQIATGNTIPSGWVIIDKNAASITIRNLNS